MIAIVLIVALLGFLAGMIFSQAVFVHPQYERCEKAIAGWQKTLADYNAFIARVEALAPVEPKAEPRP